MKKTLKNRIKRHLLWFDLTRRKVRASMHQMEIVAKHRKGLSVDEPLDEADLLDAWISTSSVQSVLELCKRFGMDEEARHLDSIAWRPDMSFKVAKLAAQRIVRKLPLGIEFSPSSEQMASDAIQVATSRYGPRMEGCPHVEHIADLLRSAVACRQMELLVGGETHVMVIEHDLAEKVLASKADMILIGDLMHMPHNSFVLEFTRKMPLIDLPDVRVMAHAVGFFRDYQSQFAAIIWYTDQLTTVLDEYPYSATCFAMGNLLSSSIDPEILPEKYKPEKAMAPLGEIVSTQSKRIWDFVTARNVDYELVERIGRTKTGKIPPKHAQMANATEREVRVLRVNRKVRIPAIRQGGGESQTTLAVRFEIPGSFHTWIYCANCGRCHRHDLIGRHCRRCRLIVGPMANIDIRRFWHEPYWRGPGDAPLREVVRELKQN